MLQKRIRYDFPFLFAFIQSSNFIKFYRALIDDWLLHCRNALGVLEPNMYILPDFPKSHNLNEYHAYFNKITIFRRKSKSAETKKRESRPSIPILPILPERSKSAFLSNILKFYLQSRLDL